MNDSDRRPDCDLGDAHLDVLRAELNAALADNAALVEALEKAANMVQNNGLHGYFPEGQAKRTAESIRALKPTGAPLLKELADLRFAAKMAKDGEKQKGVEMRELQAKLADAEKWATGLCSAHRTPDASCRICNPAVLALEDKLATVEREREGLHQTIADMDRDYRDNLRACDELLADAEAMAKALGQISTEAEAATLHKWDAPLMGLQNAIEDGDAALAVWRASHSEKALERE